MNKILEAYNESQKLDEGFSATKDFIDGNVKEMDSRAIVYLTKIGTAIFEIILNMRELKRVLLREHYILLAKSIKKDIGTI